MNEPGDSSLGGKWVLPLAVLLFVVAAVLWVREWSARAKRDAAFAALREAAGEADDKAAESAAADFRSGLPWFGADPRLASVEQMEGELSEWPALRSRNDAFERLRQSVDQSNEKAAIEAAETFLAVEPRGSDPRRAEVARLLGELQLRELRRKRDEAYVRLVDDSNSDDAALLVAAEQFLESTPEHTTDPRSEDVRIRYTDRFTRWFVQQDGPLTPSALERVRKYQQLLPED